MLSLVFVTSKDWIMTSVWRRFSAKYQLKRNFKEKSSSCPTFFWEDSSSVLVFGHRHDKTTFLWEAWETNRTKLWLPTWSTLMIKKILTLILEDQHNWDGILSDMYHNSIVFLSFHRRYRPYQLCSVQKKRKFVNPDYFPNNCQTYLILTFETEPVSIRYFFHLWFETIHVVSFVTTITEKKLCFIFSTRAKLATLWKKQD